MSYAQIKPQYYQMHMPDSPWHAGSEGWKSAPWPSFGVNPNLVGPPRLAVEGLGAYFKPVYEKPISGLGDTSNQLSGAMLIGLGALVIVGGMVLLSPKKMHANAARKKRAKRRRVKQGRTKASRAAARARRAASSGSAAARKEYAYWAKIIHRDLRAGYLTPDQVGDSLREQYYKDEGEYRRAGITNWKQFVKGVEAKL